MTRDCLAFVEPGVYNREVAAMVTLFHTLLSNRDTTRALFASAMEGGGRSDYSGILYIGPTTLKTGEARRVFHSLQSSPCYVPPEMTTLRGYCKRLYSARGRGRIVGAPLVPLILSGLSGKGLGLSTLVASLIRGLKGVFPSRDPGEISRNLLELSHELDIPDAVLRTLTDSLELFREYSALSERAGFVDEEDLLGLAGDRISGWPGPSVLILDSLSILTPAEERLVSALIGSAGRTLISVAPEQRAFLEGFLSSIRESVETEEISLSPDGGGPEESLLIHTASDREGEMEEIAREIKALSLSGRCSDLSEVMVVFPQVETARFMAERVFTRYGIPFRVLPASPEGRQRPFLDLLCLLRAVAEGYPRRELSQFLASPFFAGLPPGLGRMIPSLMLRSGIVSGRDAWLDFFRHGSEAVDMSAVAEAREWERGLERLFQLLRPLEEASPTGLDSLSSLLASLLDELGFLSPPRDAADRSLRKTMDGILEQLSFLGSLSDRRYDLPELTEIISALLDLSPSETEESGVRIMGLSDASCLSARYLFMAGLTDRDMPGRMEMDHLLPDGMKKRLGLVDLDSHMEMQRADFHRTVRSALGGGCGLRLSYPLTEGEDLFLPSPFLYTGQEVRGGAPGIFSPEELQVLEGRGALSSLLTEIAAPHRPARPVLNITDLDAYRACPRRFFIERVLGLRPLEIKEYEPEPATLGTIVHRVMERLMAGPFYDFAAVEERAKAVLDEALQERRMAPYWKDLIRESILQALPRIFDKEQELREDGYLATRVEETVRGELLEGVELKGKVDRIDEFRDHLQVIDYKTGSADLNCKQSLEGRGNLQLFLYAAMLREMGKSVRRVGIYSLKTWDIKWCPTRRKSKGQEPAGMEEHMDAALGFLGEAVREMGKGRFPADPLNDYTCWSCHENAFCPYIQK